MEAVQKINERKVIEANFGQTSIGGSDQQIESSEVSARQALVALEAVESRSYQPMDQKIVRNIIDLGLLQELPRQTWEDAQKIKTSADKLYTEVANEERTLKMMQANLDSQQRVVSNPFQAMLFGIDSLFGGNKGETLKQHVEQLYIEVKEQKKLVDGKELAADMLQRELDTSYDVHLLGNIPVKFSAAGKDSLQTLRALSESLDGQTYNGMVNEIKSFNQNIQAVLADSEKVYSALLSSGFQRDD
jgi:hypothetical protein